MTGEQQADAARAKLVGRYWLPPEPDLHVHALGGVRVFSLRRLDDGVEAIIVVPPKAESSPGRDWETFQRRRRPK